MTGICYFCEETKSLKKNDWKEHILRHTGEKAYCCPFCNEEVDSRKQHDSMCNIKGCYGKVFDICESNSDDESWVAFMCNDCNFVQCKQERMIKHLTEEHGYDLPAELQNYQKLTLVPSFQRT